MDPSQLLAGAGCGGRLDEGVEVVQSSSSKNIDFDCKQNTLIFFVSVQGVKRGQKEKKTDSKKYIL